MAAPVNTEELLRRLDEQHQAYLKTFRLVHEALAQSAAGAANPATTVPASPPLAQLAPTVATNTAVPPRPSTPVPHTPATPTPLALNPIALSPIATNTAEPTLTLAPGAPPRSRRPSRRRSTIDGDAERPEAIRKPATYHSSVFTGESDESEDDGDLYVQTPLPPYAYDHEDLRDHLKTYKFNEEGKTLLETVVANGRLKTPMLFPDYPSDEKWHNSHYSVFDVGQDGAPLSRREVVQPGTASIDSAIWQAVQDLNSNPEALRPAVGRITIVREPSPIVLGALHLTMNNNFDMDEVFRHLMQENHSSAQMLDRAFLDDQRQQRSIIFNFDYFTIVGDEAQPMPWQRTDRKNKVRSWSDEHIPISRCGSVVALSLTGGHIKKLRNASRRAKTQNGFIYDPWAPWHVLNIQCYPDHRHSMDSHDSTKHYVNGPEAFLHTLLAEFKDAEKRYGDIYTRITKLVTPPADFMFDGSLRDKLLFEDQEFTYSRRYFWAFQTLGIMNNGIKAILDAYEDTFTDEVWEGKHKSLWPMMEENSSRNVYWRKRMASLRRDFEKQNKNLEKLHAENDDRRKEIRTLRDQLFSGTSVLESRKSVELSEVTILQGHNIKLLTLVSIFFLPMTFVTSVFGMTNMPTEHEFNVFAIVMCTVCIPFFLLIGSLNTTSGMEFWRSKWHQSIDWITRRKPSEDEPERKKKSNPGVTKAKERSLSASIAMEARKAQVKPAKGSAASINGGGTEKPEISRSNSKSQDQTATIEAVSVSKPASNMSMGAKKSNPMISAVSSTEKAATGTSHTGNELSPSWWDRLMCRRRRDLGHEHHV